MKTLVLLNVQIYLQVRAGDDAGTFSKTYIHWKKQNFERESDNMNS